MIKIRTRSPEEVDRAKAPVVEAAVITIAIAETTQLQINIHLKEK